LVAENKPWSGGRRGFIVSLKEAPEPPHAGQ
jgi:hypothetical protein